MNHVMYADDICLIASSAIGFPKMFDVRFNFSLIKKDIMFNPVKSVSVTFKPKNSKLSSPNVRLDSNILEYIKVRSVPEKLFSLIIEIGRQKYVQSCIFTR